MHTAMSSLIGRSSSQSKNLQFTGQPSRLQAHNAKALRRSGTEMAFIYNLSGSP